MYEAARDRPAAFGFQIAGACKSFDVRGYREGKAPKKGSAGKGGVGGGK